MMAKSIDPEGHPFQRFGGLEPMAIDSQQVTFDCGSGCRA